MRPTDTEGHLYLRSFVSPHFFLFLPSVFMITYDYLRAPIQPAGKLLSKQVTAVRRYDDVLVVSNVQQCINLEDCSPLWYSSLNVFCSEKWKIIYLNDKRCVGIGCYIIYITISQNTKRPGMVFHRYRERILNFAHANLLFPKRVSYYGFIIIHFKACSPASKGRLF